MANNRRARRLEKDIDQARKEAFAKGMMGDRFRLELLRLKLRLRLPSFHIPPNLHDGVA
jgi:hypothetical protein